MFKIANTLTLPLSFVTTTQAILGKKRCGKSYKASVQAEELLAHGHQVVIMDPTGAWNGLRSSADGREVGFPITILGGDHGDVPLEASAGEVIAEAIVTERFSAILDLSNFTKGEELRFAAAFIETLYRKNKEAMHLFIDEADIVAPQRPFGPDEAKALGACQSLVRRGGIKGIGCTLITQRPQVLNKDVLSQVDMLTCLRMSHPKDLAAIGEWVAVHGDHEVAKKMIASLPSLPKGDAWMWAPVADIFARVTYRDRRTFDSGRTPEPGERARAPKVLAHVDIEHLGEAIRGSAERAKASDPKALRAKIVELEKLVRDATSTNDRLGIAAASGEEARRTESDLRARVADLEASMLRLAEEVRAGTRETAGRIGKVLAEVGIAPPAAAAAAPGTTPAAADPQAQPGGWQHAARWQAPRAIPQAPLVPPCAARSRTIPQSPLASPPPPPRAPAPAPKLATGEEAILRALVQFPAGLSPEQLTVICGYKRSSRDSYLQRLGKAGLVERRDRFVIATAAGLAALPDAAPLPTGRELQEHWRQRLPAGEAKILDVLIEHWPSAMARDELGETAGFSRSTTNTYLQRLGARELVTTGPDGARASDTLFDGGSR